MVEVVVELAELLRLDILIELEVFLFEVGHDHQSLSRSHHLSWVNIHLKVILIDILWLDFGLHF